jgi:hypothetical protein
MVYEAEKFLKEHGDKVDAEKKAKVESSHGEAQGGESRPTTRTQMKGARR